MYMYAFVFPYWCFWGGGSNFTYLLFSFRFCASKREKRNACREASSEDSMQSCPNVRPSRSRHYRSRQTPRGYRPSSETTPRKGWNATRNRWGGHGSGFRFRFGSVHSIMCLRRISLNTRYVCCFLYKRFES